MLQFKHRLANNVVITRNNESMTTWPAAQKAGLHASL